MSDDLERGHTLGIEVGASEKGGTLDIEVDASRRGGTAPIGTAPIGTAPIGTAPIGADPGPLDGDAERGVEGVSPGTQIAARYELVALLGRGGMGEVWRARQLNLNREVALKLLLPSDVESPRQALRRFDREARVASAIMHPNVVKIHDVGEHAGLTYLAMELLHGESLRDRLEQVGALEVADVLELGPPLADALVAAHEVGAVHRDLKPENIFLDRAAGSNTTRVVVLDFGLAFIERGDEQLGRMTRAGVVMGTPDYLSPEQARGGEIGPASDVYSLGCVIYELLAGRPPFSGSQLNVLTQHLYVMPEPLEGLRSGLPRELVDLTMAMLRKRPEERPHAAEVRDQLALMANTLAGRRERGRGAQYLQDRAERMLSYSPTAPLTPTPAQAAARASANALGVAFVGELSEEIELGLLSNEVAILPWPGADPGARPTGFELVFVADAGPRGLVELVAALVAEGLTVVAAIDSSQRELMGELARVGASEITTLPLAVDNVVRSLRRAKRRHDRQQRKRAPRSSRNPS